MVSTIRGRRIQVQYTNFAIVCPKGVTNVSSTVSPFSSRKYTVVTVCALLAIAKFLVKVQSQCNKLYHHANFYADRHEVK